MPKLAVSLRLGDNMPDMIICTSDANKPEVSQKEEITNGSGSKPRKIWRFARDWELNLTVKDAWQTDGWWESMVIQKQRGGIVRVDFPDQTP
ncbi:uncharacterized protein LOC141634303 isoform X3 [Silene latifolia]|uniref:uncharacterized protein LOC141634303 isoform X3 n=1 Tax=Silene latifolia TaxID=37657 RepID=UPI003D7701E7